ncbi:MAG: hypothetical protein J6D44_06780 [Pseudomonas sp.]|nr:hypothetical protein [Pseudomonas sp.]
MKLVDILAREVKIWPEGYGDIGQAESGKLHVVTGWNYRIGWTPESYTQAEDWASAVITRTEWQAAVDALNADKCEHSYANNIGCPECGELNAPKVVEWDGEGYPPIGLFCEYRGTESGIWSGCEIVATRNNAWIVLGDGYETDFVTLESLRPRRTAEQVAAEERDKAIKEMMQHGVDAGDSTIEYSCAALYDAGYRKEPKPCGS